MFRFFTILFFAQFTATILNAQVPNFIRNNPIGNISSGHGNYRSGGDSLDFKHRDDLADSITIYYHYLDSLKNDHLDSSLGDFDRFYVDPANYVNLGNTGRASYPVLFTPILKTGWDAGFHAFDLYRYKLEDTRFFKTTRPYTLLTYILSSGKEQLIKILHTQNIKPNWNAGVEYRSIIAPGYFSNQNTNHNNFRFFSNYQGKRKRYAAYLVIMTNTLASSENGGITNDSSLTNPNLKKRYSVPVNLGGNTGLSQNVFSNAVHTGNAYADFTAFARQTYDFGLRDSIIINDTTKEYLFYPKLRLQHTISFRTFSFKFHDDKVMQDSYGAIYDTAILQEWYNLNLTHATNKLFFLQDKWNFLTNDFSVKQFPDKKNTLQFLEAGIRLENFSGTFTSSPRPDYLIQLYGPKFSKNFYNIVLHGEYRNKTRNRKWDAVLQGEFYSAGYNAGNYRAYATLARELNAKFGNVQVSFENVNRSPSYIFNGSSSFSLDSNSITKNENITVLAVSANNPRFSIMARNISITNYAYFKNLYQTDQFNGLVNITQFVASTKNKVAGHLNLYSDFIVQQTAGNNPIRVPLFFTRQRLSFEGNFFKNLFISTGLDVSYNTPYKPYGYSPLEGQFVPQDTTTISNLPCVNAYLDFRIKSFTGVVKVENLNTVNVNHGFDFTNNSFAAPLYPTPGLVIRVGVQWGFVN